MGKKLIIPGVSFAENAVLRNSIKIKTKDGNSEIATFYRRSDSQMQGVKVSVDSGVLTSFPENPTYSKYLDSLFYRSDKNDNLVSANLSFEGEYSADYAFANNVGLNDVSLSGKLISITKLFSACESLKKVYLDNCDLSDCDSSDFCFSGSGITNCDLSNTNFKVTGTCNEMFSNCVNLRTITLPSGSLNKCTSLRHFATGCINLEAINIGTQDFGDIPTSEDWLSMCPIKSITGTIVNIGKNSPSFGIGNRSQLDALSVNMIINGLYDNSGNPTKKLLYINKYTALTSSQEQMIANKNWEVRIS